MLIPTMSWLRWESKSVTHLAHKDSSVEYNAYVLVVHVSNGDRGYVICIISWSGTDGILCS